MSSFLFVPAVKSGSKIRMALTGPAGSGKTFTALTIGSALGPNPGLVDTERHRARKYADLFRFAHLPQDRFDPEDLIRITIAAAEQGIDPLIVDTASPYWSGAEGVLDRVGREQRSFDGWSKMRPIERQMLDAICGYPGHVIVNMRVKTEWVVDKTADGKTEVKKVGLRPEQTNNIEYEFDITGDMEKAVMTISKSMCPELTDKVIARPDAEVAGTILRWLERDAVGQPLNPITVREWAMDTVRTPEELRAKHDEIIAAGQGNAVVYTPNGIELIGIAEFLGRMASTIKNREARLAASASNGAAVAA